jgi:hypothetical protein
MAAASQGPSYLAPSVSMKSSSMSNGKRPPERIQAAATAAF